MKETDLMIGDWVTGKKWRENPFKLNRINDNGKYYYGVTASDAQVGPFFIEEIEPIPLTPEILEKNCFEEDGEGVYGDDNSFFIPIYQNGCGIGMWETHIEPTEGIGDFSGKLKYVHELQHALKLCGIEKEIKL